MSDEPIKRRWWSRAWVWWAAALLVLYPLSMGPAWHLKNAAHMQNLFELVYWPLDCAADTCPPFGIALDSYLRVWGFSETLPDPWSLHGK